MDAARDVAPCLFQEIMFTTRYLAGGSEMSIRGVVQAIGSLDELKIENPKYTETEQEKENRACNAEHHRDEQVLE